MLAPGDDLSFLPRTVPLTVPILIPNHVYCGQSMLGSDQSKFLHVLVRMSRARSDGILPPDAEIGRYVSEDFAKRKDGGKRAINGRIKRLIEQHNIPIYTVNNRHHRIDASRIATSAATAHYLLEFRRLFTEGPVTKDLLHTTLLQEAPQPFSFSQQRLEDIYKLATGRANYIDLPTSTIPDELGRGPALDDQEGFLELLRDDDRAIIPGRSKK